jgi:flagellar motor switch protein FliN
MSEDMKQDVAREPAADVAEPEAGQKRAQAAAKEQHSRKKEPVAKASFEPLSRDGSAPVEREDVNLDVVLDIPVTLSTEIGRTRIPIRSLLQLNQGSVVELDRLAGEPLDVYVNGTLIAHGEVVVVNEKFGIRLTDVISPAERVKKLK